MKSLGKRATIPSELRYLGLLFLLFGYIPFHLAGQATDGAQSLQEALREAKSEITREEASPGELRERLRSIGDSLQERTGSDDIYLQAKLEYLFGDLAELAGNSAEGESRFQKAADLADSAMQADPENADARRLLADSLIRLAEHRGKFFGMRVIGRVRELLETAHEMEPGDPAIQVSLAKLYATAPKALGGDVGTAIDLCQAALKHGAGVQRFRAYLVLAQVREEEGNRELARRAALHAVELYPGNTDARERLAELK